MPGMDGFAVAEQLRNHADLSSTAVMMLSSAFRSGDITRCEQLGIRAFLTKPVTQEELLSAILQATDLSSPASANPVPASFSGSSAKPLHILLVEDNAINRAVAVGMLTKRGHRVAIATSGVEALELVQKKVFDRILMDVQMPGMDGLEATKRIRAIEAALNSPRSMIIATTAHAMQGDRDRCFEAGMDRYVA